MKSKKLERQDPSDNERSHVRKGTKASLDLLKNAKLSSENVKQNSRNLQRNTTPLKSKASTLKDKGTKERHTTDRKKKRSTKNLRETSHIESEANLTTGKRSKFEKAKGTGKRKCSECGDNGFKDVKELTNHQHKYCKAFKKCKNCDKLLKATDFENHLSTKCKKRKVIKHSEENPS